MTGILCRNRVYAYNGRLFEWSYNGPWPLRKDGEPYKRAGNKFWNDIEGFIKMEKSEQQRYLVIDGGCMSF